MNVDDHLVTPIRNADKCQAVQLTPAGRGAIATIRLDGLQARVVAQRHLSKTNGRTIDTWPANRATLAIWNHGDVGEEVVIYSPNDRTVEIHCHGGIASAKSILQSLAKSGCHISDWQEWTSQRTEFATCAEAMQLLPHATTERTALCLLDQFHGALQGMLGAVVEAIDEGAVDGARDQVLRLLETYRLGRHLAEPWHVVLGGPPNAGKSSLMNRLLGYERSLVFDQPGTTRDALRGNSAISGWPVEFVDTAGWRDAEHPPERAGVQIGKNVWASADLRVLVLDATRPTEWEAVRRRLAAASSAARNEDDVDLVVWNKIDLLPAFSAELPSVSIGSCAVSALVGTGCQELLDMLARLLVPHPASRGTAIVFTKRQHDFLRAAVGDLTGGNRTAAKDAIVRCQRGAWKSRQGAD